MLRDAYMQAYWQIKASKGTDDGIGISDVLSERALPEQMAKRLVRGPTPASTITVLVKGMEDGISVT